LISSLSGGIRC